MWWNNVETKPWGFYPLGWDIRLLEKLGTQTWQNEVYAGKTIFESATSGEEALGIRVQEEDYQYPNIGEDEVNLQVKQGEHITMPHRTWMFYLPRICNHCTYPACLAACPKKAIYKRKEDGIVLIDQSRCDGHQECVRACPYKKTFFRSHTSRSEKCIACYPGIEGVMQKEGNVQPQCVQNCIGKIRLCGYKSRWDSPKEDNPIDYLIHIKKVALPLYPQFGLEPNVYYIPPIHVPESFNKQLFGPGVKKAVEAYHKGYEDIKLIGIVMLMGSTNKVIHSYKVEGNIVNGFCYGYDASGNELVKVPIKEPIMIRQAYDQERKVPRLSIT
jgi:nitrate reductase beta subunit